MFLMYLFTHTHYVLSLNYIIDRMRKKIAFI